MESNKSIAQLVKDRVEKNSFLVDYLNRGLINVAALAREILPEIEKENPNANTESIAIAIKRLPTKKDQAITEQLKKIVSNVQLNVRTDILLLVFNKDGELPDKTLFNQDDIYFVNQGSNEVTVIIDGRNERLVKEKHIFKKDNLSTISLRDSLLHEGENYRTTPGFVYIFLSNISKRGINIEDIISAYSQVTFVVEQKYLPEVYQICQDVVDLKYL